MSSSADSNPEPESPVTLGHFNIRAPRRKIRETFFGKIQHQSNGSSGPVDPHFYEPMPSTIVQNRAGNNDSSGVIMSNVLWIRTFNTFTALEWTYLGFSFVGLTASIGLTIARVVSRDTNSSDFTFGILLLLTIAFCYYYVVDSVLTERADELMVFVVSNFIVLIYCIVNYALQARSTVKLVRLIVVCILSTLLIPSGLYLCYSLLKFDLQLQLSMLIMVMGAAGTSMDQTQKFILGYGVVFTVIFVITGFVGLRQENRILMIVFYVLALFEPAYVAYKFYYAVVYEKKDAATYESTFACGCFAVVVWIALMIFTGYYTKYCFYKGLREKMFGYAPKNVPPQPPVAAEDNTNLSSSSSMAHPVETAFPQSLPSDNTPPASLSVITVEVHDAN